MQRQQSIASWGIPTQRLCGTFQKCILRLKPRSTQLAHSVPWKLMSDTVRLGLGGKLIIQPFQKSASGCSLLFFRWLADEIPIPHLDLTVIGPNKMPGRRRGLEQAGVRQCHAHSIDRSIQGNHQGPGHVKRFELRARMFGPMPGFPLRGHASALE